jgi:hypothetical protein
VHSRFRIGNKSCGSLARALAPAVGVLIVRTHLTPG